MKATLALLASLFALAAAAIDPPKPAPAADPAQEEAAEAAPEEDAGDEAEADADTDEEALPPLPAEAEPAGPPPQRFNPTEKVRADFPVSFPIDI